MSKIPRTWILGLLGLTGIKNWLTSLSLLNVFLGKRFCCSHCYRAAKRNQQGTENHKYKLCSPACEPTCRSKTFLFKLKYLAREQRVSFLFRLQANQLLALLWVAVVTTQASVCTQPPNMDTRSAINHVIKSFCSSQPLWFSTVTQDFTLLHTVLLTLLSISIGAE